MSDTCGMCHRPRWLLGLDSDGASLPPITTQMCAHTDMRECRISAEGYQRGLAAGAVDASTEPGQVEMELSWSKHFSPDSIQAAFVDQTKTVHVHGFDWRVGAMSWHADGGFSAKLRRSE